ncbi:hypothetical protein PHYPO_G00037660 [Pangasianodon hypophthalmus]|uniref:Uncharacterized protein n=2 Tax=Pangasianodon TaxID=30992 RepID=A0A5N5MLB6_PANHP|nr:hypothetical protein PHYPO_G00037660 [Pangasianodon hypophthalmus]MCI4384485.1 hypothetical protein [Pangasianodon gigas]
MQILPFLFFMLSLGAAQKNTEWDYRAEAVKVNARGCANLTLVLGNWKYAIMTQVKDLLLNDHSTVLPDYARIGSLSEALSDLYKEFNSLKERLGELTAKFEGVESFVDEVRSGREERPRAEGNVVTSEADTRPRRKTRVVIRRVMKAGNP